MRFVARARTERSCQTLSGISAYQIMKCEVDLVHRPAWSSLRDFLVPFLRKCLLALHPVQLPDISQRSRPISFPEAHQFSGLSNPFPHTIHSSLGHSRLCITSLMPCPPPEFFSPLRAVHVHITRASHPSIQIRGLPGCDKTASSSRCIFASHAR